MRIYGKKNICYIGSSWAICFITIIIRDELMNVNKELKRYIEQNIFSQYKLNDKGHQIEHVKYVISRCYKLMLTLTCYMQ